MKYANNPQTFMNGFYSSSRNVFLTVSIAVAMYGFAGSFNLGVSIDMVKDISLLIFVFSFLLGLNNIHIFYNYIKALEKDRDNGNVLPVYVDLKIWKRYLYLKIYFMVLLVIIIIASSRRLFNRRFFK